MKKVAPAKISQLNPLIVFSFIIFLISLSDGIMSYTTPVFVEHYVQDLFVVGLVLGVSSLFGIFLNLFVAERLYYKDYRFFLTFSLIFAFIFPLVFAILPPIIVFFVMAMIFWSIYYEFRDYSKYNFINKFVSLDKHTEAWSIVIPFQALAYMLAPAIAIYSLGQYIKMPFHVSMAVISLAAFIFLFFVKSVNKRKRNRELTPHLHKTLLKELKIIRILFKRVWALWLFNFSLTLLDVSFWITGVLYTEKLRTEHELGALFMIVYGIPALFVGLIAPRIQNKLGKQKTALLTGILAGFGLICVGLAKPIYTILAFVFFTAICSGTTVILVSSIFEDFVTRLREKGNEIVSVNQMSINLAYALGPVFLGLVSKFYGFGATFIAVGINLALVALLGFFVLPKSIRMPQKDLAKELPR